MLQAVKKDEAILGMRTYKLLGDLQARQALGHLQKRLDEEVVRQHDWRREQDARKNKLSQSKISWRARDLNLPWLLNWRIISLVSIPIRVACVC